MGSPLDQFDEPKESTPAIVKKTELEYNYNSLDILRAQIQKQGGDLVIVEPGSEAIVISKTLSPELILKVSEQVTELRSITAISNQEDAAKANATLKKAKTLIKSIEQDRKQITSILDAKVDGYIALQRSATNDLDGAVAAVNNSILAFQKKQEEIRLTNEKEAQEKKEALAKKAQEEFNRKAEINKRIGDFKANVITAAAASKTVEDINEKIVKLKAFKLTEDKYQEFLPAAKQMHQECVAIMEARKLELMKIEEAEKNNPSKAEALKAEADARAEVLKEDHELKAQAIEEELKTEKQDSIMAAQTEEEWSKAMAPAAKGVMRRWTFDPETIDMSLLPDEYKTFDEKKIKEAIKNGAREIPGVKITQEMSNVSK